ncbi:MAG: segregation and condensation protein A [Candidatus Hepatoplasma vulgare]|nr:MAG: segregation and condensation protein A [Candidatus Hepatoplasma sp.]
MIKNKKEFKLDNYEGPLDLLLNLIKSKKMSINEISLFKVIDQFIELVNNSKDFNLNDFSEYLLYSAELLSIKSKYLVQKENENNSFVNDKKTKRLLEQLIEYEKYKNLSEKMLSLYENNIIFDKKDDNLDDFLIENTTKNLFLKDHNKQDIEIAIRNIYKMLNEKKPLSTTLKVKRISVEQRRKQLEDFFLENEKITFFELIGEDFSIYMIAITLLCILEMSNSQIIKILQNYENDEILIERIK